MSWEAVLPIVTLVLGYFGSLYTESRRDKRQREQAELEVIVQTEREALLELQDRLPNVPPAWQRQIAALNKIGTQGHLDPSDQLSTAFEDMAQVTPSSDSRQPGPRCTPPATSRPRHVRRRAIERRGDRQLREGGRADGLRRRHGVGSDQ